MAKDEGMKSGDMSMMDMRPHVFTQTNKTNNEIIHYRQNPDGTLMMMEKVSTGGKGTDGFKVVTNEKSAPDPLLSAGSVTLSGDNKYLYVANGGDNSVSVLRMESDGKLKLVDNTSTGESGTTNSVAVNMDGSKAYALHSFGPNHIKELTMMNGKLTVADRSSTVNTATAKDRIPTQAILTPDGRHLLVDVIFNARPKPGEDGPMLTPANKMTKDGIVMFDIMPGGQLGPAKIMDSGVPTPFSLQFLKNGTNDFVNTFAAGNGAALSKIENGAIKTYPVTKVDLSAAPDGPAETCWVSISEDGQYAYASNFGLGTVTGFRVTDSGLTIVKDKQAKTTGGNGFKALAGIPTTGPADNYLKGDYFYQLHGNAGKLIAYRHSKGILTEIGSYEVPRDAVQGLTGF